MHYELNSGKPISFQEGSLGEILFFRHTELCYISQAEVYEVKIRICDALGVHSKQNPFPCKGKKTSEVQLCFPWGTLASRQGTAEDTKFPSVFDKN